MYVIIIMYTYCLENRTIYLVHQHVSYEYFYQLTSVFYDRVILNETKFETAIHTFPMIIPKW